jgi:hypothetical protein
MVETPVHIYQTTKSFIRRNAEMLVVTRVKTSHLVFWYDCSLEFTWILIKTWKSSVTKVACTWVPQTRYTWIDVPFHCAMVIVMGHECKHLCSIQQFDRMACVLSALVASRKDSIFIYIYIYIYIYIHLLLFSYFSLALQPSAGYDLLVHEVSWSARRTNLYLTTHKHPSHRWDSNPWSQQASGRRPTP